MRVRLWAIAAQVSQASFALNRPEGRCATGPAIKSALICSMDRVARGAGFRPARG